MKLHRSSRVVAALIALVSLLFMQLAVAAYACPMQSPEPAVKMANCHGMDRESPSLCHAYGEVGKQSLDKTPTPAVQPFVAAGVVIALVRRDLVLPSGVSVPASFLFAAGGAPPIAIQHCCFRI